MSKKIKTHVDFSENNLTSVGFSMFKYISILIFLAPINAQDYTGDNFYRQYKSENKTEYTRSLTIVRGIAMGYEEGLKMVIEGENIDQNSEIINSKVNEYSILAYVPNNVTLAQLCDLIWKYLDDHPENRKRPMSEIYVDAMINIFLP